MQQAPILLIGFNRPERLARLIDSLRPLAPPILRIAIDGPRFTVESDKDLVRKTADVAYQVDWEADLSVHLHPNNLGITEAIPWAVSWVLEQFDRVIVIEDDVTVGHQFLEFASAALTYWEDDSSTFAISGYNMVPQSNISTPHLAARYSKLPHSYAWATWRRAWVLFDSQMRWAQNQNLRSLQRKTGSLIRAIRWQQLFRHVRHNRVTTWDYQWVQSIWAHDGRVVVPNHNLIEYHGQTDGTHTERSRSWEELTTRQVPIGSVMQLKLDVPIDERADAFVYKFGHRASLVGVILGFLEGPVIRVKHRWPRRRKTISR